MLVKAVLCVSLLGFAIATLMGLAGDSPAAAFAPSAITVSPQYVGPSDCLTQPNVLQCPPTAVRFVAADPGTVVGATALGAVYVAGAMSSGVSGLHLAAPIVSLAAPGSNAGYYLAGADGGVFAFGGAVYSGSMAGRNLAAPIVAIAASGDDQGYWLVGADGGVFAFGDAGFYGSMGGQHLNAPIVGIATTSDGEGYWLVASDGGVFAFGDAGFYGSMGGQHLNGPITAIAANGGGGYWLAGRDGGIFAFGNAGFGGSFVDQTNAPVIAIAYNPPQHLPSPPFPPPTYSIATTVGQVYSADS